MSTEIGKNSTRFYYVKMNTEFRLYALKRNDLRRKIYEIFKLNEQLKKSNRQPLNDITMTYTVMMVVE